MKNSLRVVWFLSTLEDVNFYNAFKKNFNHPIDLFHTNLLTYTATLFEKCHHMLPRHSSEELIAYDEIKIKKSFNVLSNRLSAEEAVLAYAATRSQLLKYLQEKTPESVYFMIPSGRHIHHIAATDIANTVGIKKLYINYANFPGYAIFDRLGTDMSSEIFLDPEILTRDKPSPNRNLILEKFNEFKRLKDNQKRIPQRRKGKILALIKDFAFFIDHHAQKVFNIHGDRRLRKSVKKELSAHRNSSALHQKVFDKKLPDSFIFFPLQVSTDQQVLVNYQGQSIYAAINEALNLSSKLKLPLVVKEHPAESNPKDITNYIIKLQKDGRDIIISNEPVYFLIEKCQEVITINSTVGLEARLAGKHVTYLGHSLYKKLSDEQLYFYLSEYLVPVDYHNTKTMTRSIVKEIVERF